ncbi:hypothetical protein FGRMN_5735 [Fusarium graminum]|nr:hypothetical protein FGRMN_5735 [Fusarium graminum]
MSGLEVFSLVTGIITVIDATIKLYDAARDVSGLPSALRDVASRLPLIQESLILAKDGLQQQELSQRSFSALGSILDACGEKVTELHNLFEKMMVASGTPRRERYFQVMRTISQGDKVKRLMDEVVADIQVLTLHHVIKASRREQIYDLLHEIQTKRDCVGTASIVVNSNGLGKYYVHNGVGDQNIAGGTAIQITGQSSGSTFNFVHK